MLCSCVYCHFLPTEIRKLVNDNILARSRIDQDEDLTPLIVQDRIRPLSQKRYYQKQTLNNLIFLALRIRSDIL